MFEEHFFLAGEGKSIWENLDKKYRADRYILLPHKNNSYNRYALLHLRRFLDSKRVEKAVLLAADPVVKKALPLFIPKDDTENKHDRVECIIVSDHEVDAILKYYALYEFTSRLTIISLRRPYDTYGENLIGVKGITKEDLLCLDIYRFSERPKASMPDYQGDDEELRFFLEMEREEQI